MEHNLEKYKNTAYLKSGNFEVVLNDSLITIHRPKKLWNKEINIQIDPQKIKKIEYAGTFIFRFIIVAYYYESMNDINFLDENGRVILALEYVSGRAKKEIFFLINSIKNRNNEVELDEVISEAISKDSFRPITIAFQKKILAGIWYWIVLFLLFLGFLIYSTSK